MATWANNLPNGAGPSARRRWKLEDRESLKNLKHHIAEEGCSDVQFDLAKQLLQEESNDDHKTSSQKAVHWLLSAAQQGHEGALTLLKQCFENGAGITAENELEVIKCLTMTQGERAARKAARELFACLANGNEHITPRQLERKMRKIYNMQKRRRRHGENVSSSEDDSDQEISKELLRNRSYIENCHMQEMQNSNANAVITEENLVTAAINYTAGRLPAVNDALTLSVPHPDSLDHVPCFHRIFLHPIIFFTLLYHRFINLVSALPIVIPLSARLVVLLLVYLVAANESLTIYFPLGFYYTCISIMIWSSCRMLKTKHNFIDFRIWSGLFLSYGDHNVEAEISENRFLKNNMKPYLYFFCAFVGCMVVYPQINSDWLPHSELTMLSCFFVFVTLFTFVNASDRQFPDWMVLLSFGVNVLAKYPYEMDEVVTTGWRFLDLKVPTFSSFVIGNGIEFCLSCRTALYLLIPVFLLLLAKRSKWRGIYIHLIPHCVTLSWLQLCINASQSATFFGVLRSTLGLAGICLFLPMFGIVSLLLPVFVAIDWLGFTDPNLRYGSAALATFLALLGTCFLAINRQTQKYITAFQVITCIIAACVLTFPYMTSTFKDPTRFGNNIPHDKQSTIMDSNPTEYLTWRGFSTICGPSSWAQNKNKISTQLRCTHLEGINVEWEGAVVEVRLNHVSNIYEHLISKYLPNWLANIIRCSYGIRVSEEIRCDQDTYTFCREMLKIFRQNELFVANKCSLQNWNTYDYEILVKIRDGILDKGTNIVLHASHHFSNFTQNVRGGDVIRFQGTLMNSRQSADRGHEDFVLSSSNPSVKVKKLKCSMCPYNNIPTVSIEPVVKSTVNERMRELTRGIKYLLNVLLNPLIILK